MKTVGLRKILTSALAGAVVLCALALGTAQAEEWRVATLAPQGSVWMKILSRGAAEIEKATEGRVKIKYYPGGVQGDEKDAVRKMGLGQLDGAALTSVGLSLIDESIRVLELPTLFNSVEELDYVRNKMWGRFRSRFESKGYMLGEPGDVGFVYFYSNKPIRSLGDIKSTKMWRWSEDKLSKAMFAKLGINGKPLGVPEVLPALNTGRINAAYGSPVAVVSLQWYTKVKYSTSMPMSYSIGATVLRKEAWEKVSDADKKVVRKIFKIQSKKLRKAVRKDNRRARKSMSRTVKEEPTPDKLKDLLITTAKAVWTEQVGKIYSKADLDAVLKHLETYRAKN